MPRRTSLTTLALVAALGGTAAAQTPPTPDQARVLEGQVTAWLRQIVASTTKLPARPVEITSEGDHYLARVKLAGLGKVTPTDAAVTAKLRQLDATRWAVDDQQFPNVTITTTQIVPDAPDAKNPSPDGKHAETVTYQIKLGQQDVNSVSDPTYATATTGRGSVASLDMVKTDGGGQSTTHLGRITSQSSSQPTDPAHVNMMVDVAAEGYSFNSVISDGSHFGFSATRTHTMGAISGLAHDKLSPVIQALATLGEVAKATSTDEQTDGPSPAEKAALRTLLEKAKALLTGAKMEQSMEGVAFDTLGNTGSIDRLALAIGGDAPQDMLAADMTLTLDGLKVDGLPPNLAAYMPLHFTIHPTLSNVSVPALTRMGMDVTSKDPSAASSPGMQSLFAQGGVNIGFDQLALEIVDTALTGTGKFLLTGPDTITGQAEFTARGLDGLITKLQADPMLAQGVPVVIFLKGIARSTADRAVWQVSVNNTKVLVNGVDLMAMAAGFGK